MGQVVDAGTWRVIAEWDWTVLADDVDGELHAVGELDGAARADEDWQADGVTACGRHGTLLIPGMGTRMSARRCDGCCAATGMPAGTQSPKNDPACRPQAQARVDALGADPGAPSG